jgi:hypothetical protein
MFNKIKRLISAVVLATVVLGCVTPAFAATRKAIVTGTFSYQGPGVQKAEFRNANSTPVVYTLSVSQSWKNAFNASVSVGSGVVKGATGYNFDYTYTVNESIQVTCSPKYVTKVWIAPLGQRKSFKVYDDYGTYCKDVGTGNAYSHTGKIYTFNGYAI